MMPVEENAVLGSDLDCQDFMLLNVTALDPVPPPLVSADDIRLSDQRPVPEGSVTDLSVAPTAAIDQSKLSFNGVPPEAWLGNADNQFARGDQVQLLSQKGAPDGYAALDENGLIAASHITTGPSGGKVNSVGLLMPQELSVGSPAIFTSGVFSVAWANAANGSWFGAAGSTTLGPDTTSLSPYFVTQKLPMPLIPGLDASKFSTGVFDLDLLPLMSGVGSAHAPGLVPDTGENGDPHDYLGRDGKWRAFAINLSYQPTLPNVSLTQNPFSSITGNSVTLRTVAGAVLFYRINGGDALDPLFIEVHDQDRASSTITLLLQAGDYVETYAAKAGYNNSNMVTYEVQLQSISFDLPPPPATWLS